ncbi:hypothetical protein VIGAN_08303500 [Vigna angularis var. angularis]|uniref:Uncharacterized protein n=1 Tax=Vigna angularis var. angularis TaxID=157739 RepID=A0A0S3STM4_PHAAN|nr:hypothetical protein VIGAN_08303500 [Vigna angularis var. angularis]
MIGLIMKRKMSYGGTLVLFLILLILNPTITLAKLSNGESALEEMKPSSTHPDIPVPGTSVPRPRPRPPPTRIPLNHYAP